MPKTVLFRLLLTHLVTLCISAILALFSIEILGEYGIATFAIVPFFIGFLPVFIWGKWENLSSHKALSLAFSNLVLATLALLIFTIEGLICILMALPIILIFHFLGSTAAYQIVKKRWASKNQTVLGLFFFALLSIGVDLNTNQSQERSVSTEVIVDAPIEEVWESVIEFDSITSPKTWLFKLGISCPTHAKIEGTGVGAIRYCNFSTGSFVEPITHWNPPTLLKFDVAQQPAPMKELNPFGEVNPNHLSGYLVSKKGEFRLEKISNDRTRLIGKTWYTLDIKPRLYWNLWTKFIIHRVHKRVLEHIKQVAET